MNAAEDLDDFDPQGIDSDLPVFCAWCSVERVDPDHYPYCGMQCGVAAEVDE